MTKDKDNVDILVKTKRYIEKIYHELCKSLGIKDPVKKFMEEDYPLTEIFGHVWKATHDYIRKYERNETEKKKLHYKVLRTVMAIVDVCYLFLKENLMRKSADLTYSTLMSVVPVLAIIFAMAKGFGQDHIMWIQLEKIIGSEHQLTQSIMSSVSKSIELTTIKDGYIFGVAIIALIWTANSAMYKLETIFNEVWHVENSKGWFGKLPNNCFFLMLVPSILMIVSGLFGYSEQVGNSTIIESAFWLVRIVLSSIVFFLMYKFLPDTKVGWGNALVMGIVFGCVFTIWHMVYVYFQDMLFNYNKVYGSFAAIPFFLIWALLAWSICLVGAQFCYVIQNDLFYDIDATKEFNNDGFSLQEKHQTMAKVLSLICDNLKTNNSGCTFDSIKKELGKTEDMKIIYAIENLKKKKLIHYSNDKSKQEIYPSFDINSFTLLDLMKRLFENSSTEEGNDKNKESITFASVNIDSIPTFYNKTLLDYYEEVLKPASKNNATIQNKNIS